MKKSKIKNNFLPAIKYSQWAVCSLLAAALSFQTLASETIVIPKMDDAQVFANFTDEIPAVLNYFSKKQEAEIKSFYAKEFGEPLSQERKQGRLTLSYQLDKKQIRVVISEQNNMRQVDVIIM